MRIGSPSIFRGESGQALVETALVLPVLLAIVLNCVNFGYFFVVALNLTAAPRSGVLYSILGFATPKSQNLPAAVPASTTATVANLSYEDMHGALASYSSADVQICDKKIGFTNQGTSSQIAQCQTCTSSTDGTCGSAGAGSPTPGTDPEAPTFVLHRVDVTYTFNTVIPGTAFNFVLLPSTVCTSAGSCTFHRQVSMRAMD
jgi:Flp pilus assembly protein TadG